MKSLLVVSLILVLYPTSTTTAQLRTFTDQELRDNPYFWDLMHEQDVNFNKVNRAYELYFDKHEKVKGSGFKQYERWAWEIQDRINEDGSLKPTGDKYRAYLAFKKVQKDRGPSTNAGEWVEIGPIVYPNNNTSQKTGTGRVNTVAFHPSDANKFWIGAPSGGLWATIDGGATYYSTTDQLPVIGVSSIIVNPVNPSIIYIGTGDRDGGNTSGLGVFKSLDGGSTWTQSNTGMGNKTVGMMIMDPGDQNKIIAATSGGIYRTTDSGVNWTQVSSNNSHYKDIMFHPTNSAYVYATAYGDFYRSTDNGLTWNQVSNGLISCNRMVLSVSADEANAVFCLLTVGGDFPFKGLFKSIDKGVNFSRITPESHPNILGYNDGDDRSQAWYDLCMMVDPTDSDHILVGSINIHESINGGTSFTKKTHWVGDVHADQHWVGINDVNDRVYMGNDGGLYYSDDYFDTWTEISSGLNIAQIYKIGQSAQKKERVINGYQDNGTANFEDGTFTTVVGGDGMECIHDYDQDQYAYTALYYGNIRRSTTGGQGNYWSIAGFDINGITESGGWVTPYMLHKTDPNTMFVGYKNIWRSTNVRSGTVNWTKISNNLGSTNSINFDQINQSLADDNIFYGMRTSGSTHHLFRSDNINDASPTWIDLSATLPETSHIDDIMCHPTDPEKVYLIKNDKVYRSFDKGNNWEDISGTLLSGLSLRCFTYDKNSNEGIYVGTSFGVFYKDASMTDWIAFDGDLPRVDVRELEIYYGYSDSKIRAATYGRGLWESDLYYDPASLPLANFRADKIEVKTEELVTFEDFSAFGPTGWTWTITPTTFTFENGTNVSSQHPEVKFTSAGVYTVSLQASNANGNDTKTIQSYITALGDAGTPGCTPATQNTGNWGMGIYQVQLNTINYSSGQPQDDNPNAPIGYLDVSSDQQTFLVAGETYNLTVTLGTSFDQYWGAYIDYNNDGDFIDANEKLFSSTSGVQGVQTESVTIINDPEFNQVLRMRVICEFGASVDPPPCAILDYGQAEDYGVYILDSPDLTTTIASSIQSKNADSGGNITDQGSSPVIARGLVWGYDMNPTLDQNWGSSENGTGTGSFTATMTDLNANSTYYVRAYAINSGGISYGQNESFTTLSSIPVLTTNSVTNISHFTSTTGGNISTDGQESIEVRGVVWDTSPDPSLSKSVGKTEDGTGVGSFTSSMSQLFPNTTYYAKAYARNAYSTGYGDEKMFTTLAPDANQSKDLIFSNITTSKMDISWTNGTGTSRIVKINTSNSFTPPADGTDPVGNSSYGGGEQVIFNGSGNLLSVTNLSPTTLYYFQVFDYTGSGGSTVFNIAPGYNNPSSASTYCAPTSTNSGYGDHISQFKLNSIDNISGAATYTDFSNLNTSLLPGKTYDVGIKVGYTNYINLWIDWDDDLEFESNERLIDNFVCNANVFTTTQISLPASANFGNHLLRIRCSYNTLSDPCANTAYGEGEDYTVIYKEKITWTGTTDTDWFKGDNWDVGVVPDNNYEAIIQNTTNKPLIPSGQNAQAKKVTLDAGAELNIEGNLDVMD